MKKLFPYLLFSMILLGTAYAALVGSENFENYTAKTVGSNSTFNQTLFLNESGRRWSCEDPADAPYCTNYIGALIGQSGNFTLFDTGANKFLRLWAIDGDYTHYYFTRMTWNYTTLIHEDVTASTTWTRMFRIRFVYANFLYGTGMRAGYGGERSGMGFIPPDCGLSCSFNTMMGGIYTSSVNNYTSLRLYMNSTAPAEMRPYNGFDMSDTDWHYVTQYYYINSTCDETYVEQYIDGGLFLNTTINHDFTCGDTWDAPIRIFEAYKFFAFDIDDLAVYNTKENLFVESANVSDADTCDSYSLPYYLVETFNGYLSKCDWSTSYDYFYSGALQLYNSTGYYYAQKAVTSPTDGTLLSLTASRYATMKFDLAITNAAAGQNVAVRLYDDSNQNAFLFWSDGNSFYYLNNGNSVWLANLSTSSYNWKFVFDLQRSKVDIYLNDVLLESQGDMAILNYFVKNIATFKITSSNVGYTFDNLQIYTSDSLGQTLLGDTTIIPVASNETTMCGLFRIYNGTAPSCNTNADCVTGDCMANGKCNSFDMTYCDENGYVRGNKCILAGIASCAGQGFSDVIFKNFLWVLVLLLILMAIVYLSIMVRRRQ